MIVNVHRKKTPNQGDLASAPLRYLKPAGRRQRAVYIDLFDCVDPSGHIHRYLERADAIVLGGGGLLNHTKFEEPFEYLRRHYGQKMVVWGAGGNSVAGRTCETRFEGVQLVGARDWPPEPGVRSWVPCASCLYAPIAQLRERRRGLRVNGVGILENNAGAKTAEIEDAGYTNVRRMGNKKVAMKDMLEFIMRSEIVVTSSYHAAYWATLLRTPVVAIPTSSKFRSFRHQMPLANRKNWPQKIEEVCIFEDAFEHCFQANADFLDRCIEAFPVLDGLSVAR